MDGRPLGRVEVHVFGGIAEKKVERSRGVWGLGQRTRGLRSESRFGGFSCDSTAERQLARKHLYIGAVGVSVKWT